MNKAGRFFYIEKTADGVLVSNQQTCRLTVFDNYYLENSIITIRLTVP